jgi:hypothetical protein
VLRQGAFEREIAAHWRPRTPAERALQWRSRTVHGWTRWWSGAVSLRVVGAAALVAAVGSVVLSASVPDDPAFDSHIPSWLEGVLALAVLWFAVECLLSPGSLRRGRFALASLSSGAATIAMALTARYAGAGDAMLFVGFLLYGAAGVVVAVAAASGNARLLRVGFAGIAAGAVGSAVGDAMWFVCFVRDGDASSAVGCGLCSLGALVMADGLLGDRPTLARRR